MYWGLANMVNPFFLYGIIKTCIYNFQKNLDLIKRNIQLNCLIDEKVET